jgi:riboflavin biosynthesis pyrimidine reductase
VALPASLALVYHARDPFPRDVPLRDVYHNLDVPVGPGRPAVILNMVQTLDGVLAVGGKAWSLGSDVDHYLFRTLRAWADVVLCGAGTLRENDVIAVTHVHLQGERRAAGRPANPTAVVVTRRAAFSDGVLQKRFFTSREFHSVVVTSERAREADLARLRDAGAEALVVAATPAGDVDLVAAMEALSRRGAARVLAEGGPGLNRRLVEARLLDELFLTVTPRVVARGSAPVLTGLLGGAPASLSTVSELHYRAPDVREWYFRFAVSYAD